MTTKQSIASLYWLKGICAFLVVCCHAPLFGDWGQVLVPLRSAAVPFFILITAYFLYHEDTEKLYQRLRGSLRKLVPIALICNLVYYLWVFPNHGNTLTSWDKVWDLLLYGTTLMLPLWYLTALIWALLFFMLCLRIALRRKTSAIPLYYALLPLLLLPAMAIPYEEFTHKLLGFSYSPFNALCYGLPYLSLGFLIKHHEPWLSRRMSLGAYLSIVAVFLLEALLVSYCAGEVVDGPYITTPLFAMATFVYLLRHPSWGQDSWWELVGRRYSGNIYYWHMLMLTVGRYLMRGLGLEAYFDTFAVLIAFFLAYLAAIVIVRVQERLGINILR